jgi:integrase
MTRRGANEGSIRQRKDGRWEARVLLTGPEGRRTRRSLLGRTRGDVRDRLHQALRAEAAGLPLPSGRLTVGVFLEVWLREMVRPTVRPATYRSYEGIVRVHLKPGLGDYVLAQLAAQHVQAFLNAKSATSLSPRTVAYIRSVLRQALRHAERWGMVTRNVAGLAAPPRVPKREIRPLAPDEARLFVEAIRGDRLEALYLLAIGTGLRQGEILGLCWQDVDLSGATINVRHALQRVEGRLELVPPKSLASRRLVALPAFVVDALHAQRLRQRRDRLLAGSRWRADDRALVFTTTIGTPMDGIAVTRRFQAVLRDARLPRQRFHDLRHACASLLLAQGVAPRVVMETLGHSQISLTLNTYSHVIPALGRAAADEMEAVLGRQSESRSSG